MNKSKAVEKLINILLHVHGYDVIRILPDQRIAGVQRMIFTTGLFVGLDQIGYKTRYCYQAHEDAVKALLEWNGENDPPGPWIKQKPEERLNPVLFENDKKV